MFFTRNPASGDLPVIAYQSTNPTPAAPAAAPAVPNDPVSILAGAMIELEAQCRTVDIDALDLACPTLTRAEILAHAEAAKALAKMRKRGDA